MRILGNISDEFKPVLISALLDIIEEYGVYDQETQVYTVSFSKELYEAWWNDERE